MDEVSQELTAGSVRQQEGPVEVELWVADAREAAARERARVTALGDGVNVDAFRPRERERRRVQLAMRRSVISARLGIRPADLDLREGQGRGIAAPDSGLLLSVAHHDDHTVLAIAGRGEGLGVDIEPRFEHGWEEPLCAVLAPAELRALTALPAQEQAAAYFACWTRKEAVTKALGEGLSERDLRSILVGIGPELPALRSLDGCPPREHWAVWTGDLGQLICSIALRGAVTALPRLRRWPLDFSRGDK
jgi:4'-phosphopantetheinyl transferase